jgi:cell division protein FtsI (penicillin-binding protein 3)
VDVKKDIRFRVYIAFTCICLLGVAILCKAALIQVREGEALKNASKEVHTRNRPLEAERGNIYNEDGLLLSSSVPQFNIHIDFSAIPEKIFNKEADSLALCLSHLYNDQTEGAYRKQLQDAYDNEEKYYELFRHLPYDKYEQLRYFPVFRHGKGSGGFIAEPEVKRRNPYDALASSIIGKWRPDAPGNPGMAIGLEATYNKSLKGTDGSLIEQKTTGTWMPIEGSDEEAVNGKDVVTTLDMGIQDVAEHVLYGVLKNEKCEYGTCIVMEVKTGKIKAMVNLGRDSTGDYTNLRNYALMPTEPGSTFKLVTLISLLNDKYVTINDIIDAEGGQIRFGNRVMRDSHLGLHAMPIWKAFAESSNAAMAKLANTYYYKDPDQFVGHLRALHLDKKTGIDLGGEYRSNVKGPENKSWSQTSLPWMATGYEVQITPLHTCMLYNSVANNGTMMKPYLVSAIKEYGKDVQTFKPEVLVEHIGSPEVIAQLKECTQAVVREGTAKNISSPFYTIAGKTGTAQVADKGITYRDGYYQGSFVGYFPADKPMYTICVVIRTRPHSNIYYGGAVAAPVFRMIADKIFAGNIGGWDGPLDSIAKSAPDSRIPALQATARNYQTLLHAVGMSVPAQGLQPDCYAQLSTDSTRKMVIRPKQVYYGNVPDVTGMGLKDAVYLLEQQGLHVQVAGRGKVRQQSVTPGTKIIKGGDIILQLS